MTTEHQLARDGVTLISFNRRWTEDELKMALRDFPSLAAAVEHANSSIGQPGFCDPLVVAKADGTKLWDARFGEFQYA